MWHAGAAASEGSWAAPTFRVAAAMMAAEAAAIAESSESVIAEANAEVNAMTAPIFKPFVVVRIPMPSGDYTTGEVMGLNQAGQTVGWMWDDAEGQEHPFFFDPQNGVTMLERPTGTDSGIAYAISDADPPVIVGSLFDTTESIDRAASWEEDGDFIDFYYDSETPSAAYGMNASATVIGMYKDPDEPHSFVIEADETEWNPAYTTYSAAQAINASGEVVGWHMVSGDSHAYSWVSNTTTDIHPEGWDESGANSINQYGDIAGWVIDDPDGPIPAYWYNTGSFYSFATPFPALGAESMVCGINSHGEMAVTRTDAPGAVIWQVYESADVSFNLSGMALMPDSTGQIASARAINDNLWIGGSYKATSGSDPVPCLIIPYDVDNDGNPDYREIVNEDEADANGNWLIDWAETSATVGMRSGLHGPGYDGAATKMDQVSGVQIIRQRINVKPRGALGPESPEELIYVDQVIIADTSECSQCEDLTDDLNAWGAGSDPPGSDDQREIILFVRSLFGDEEGWDDYDGLPDPSDPDIKTEALEDLHTFAYRFAHCIDYLQWGNESFGGAGQYKFRDDELGTGCTWSGPAKTFGQLGSNTCRQVAADKVITWIEEQMWAALEGSALAGRPLRMVGPGIPSSIVRGGYSCGTEPAFCSLVTEVSDLCNRSQMCFSLHAHYEAVADVLETVQKLTGTGSYTSPPWDVPIYRVATEWGPRTDFDHIWWTNNDDAKQIEYDKYFFGESPQDDPEDPWETFVADWEDGQFSGSLGLGTVLGYFSDAAFTAVCYGPSIQYDPGSPSNRNPFNIAALRATELRGGSDVFILDDDRFTPLKGALQTEVSNGSYNLDPFSPHYSTCPHSVTCPDCN